VKLIFSEQTREDYLYWQAHDRKLLERINGLIKECLRTPFAGTGKPEPLRGSLSGWWSRRITQEHRLVYRPSENGLLIAQCRYQYRIRRPCRRR
jgi:toxin YoeB